MLKDGVIDEKQLSYAIRVRSKLSTSRTMMDTLLDLGYVTSEQVQNILRNNQMNIRIGDLLLELGYLEEADLQQALGIQKELQGKKRLGEILVERGFIEERRLLETLAYQLGYSLIELNFATIDRSLLSVIPINVCREHKFIPVRREGDAIILAISDPLDQKAQDVARSMLGQGVKFVIATRESILKNLAALERTSSQPSFSDDSTIIGMINALFEETLRHIVRQNPYVIVLGEIRDNFSAETAIQAALTGHKVLTTFHTEDSIGGLARLMNMEIEAFLIASTVVCVLAQRLLRRVCPDCAETYIPTQLDLSRLNLSLNDLMGAEFKIGRGCKSCRFSGYRGRVGIFELLVMNEMVKNSVQNNASSYDIRRLSIETSGMVTLMEDGIVKAAQGLVSMKEIISDLPRLGKPRSLGELRKRWAGPSSPIRRSPLSAHPRRIFWGSRRSPWPSWKL